MELFKSFSSEGGSDHRQGCHPAPGQSCPCFGGSRGARGCLALTRLHLPAALLQRLQLSGARGDLAVQPAELRIAGSRELLLRGAAGQG